MEKLAEEEEKPGNLIEDEESLYLTKLYIDAAQLSPEFKKDIYSYTATLNDPDISDLLIETEANNRDAIIDISGDKNLVEGENTVNIVVKLDGSTVQTVYQVIVTAHFTNIAENIPSEDINDSDLMGKIKKYASIAIAVFALIITAVIVLVILLIKENRKIREEDDEDYIEEKEYNVYENNENEFINNDIEKDNFIESLYNQKNANLEEKDLTEDEKETLEEISKQTEKIFEEKFEGQSAEYSSNDIIENPLEKRKRRGKGKHSL